MSICLSPSTKVTSSGKSATKTVPGPRVQFKMPLLSIPNRKASPPKEETVKFSKYERQLKIVNSNSVCKPSQNVRRSPNIVNVNTNEPGHSKEIIPRLPTGHV